MRTTSMLSNRCLLVVVIAGAWWRAAHRLHRWRKRRTAAAKLQPRQTRSKCGCRPDLRDQITVGKPLWEEVTMQEKVAARVETDVSRVARIGSPVEGRITKMLVFEGQKVQQGQVMAMLHSNALSDTQFAFLKAFSQEHPC